jgi:hypothetical protein
MKKMVVMMLCVAASLAGCGGGGDDTPPATSQVPASASASIGGFIAYLQALVVAQDDTLVPVDVSGVTPPSDELSSPVALN